MTVRRREIDNVLVNPGMGSTTLQRFNGYKLNPGTKWTEGYPIEYHPFTGKLRNENHPHTSIVSFRMYGKFFEPEDGRGNSDLLDNAVSTARQRWQTLTLGVAPRGTGEDSDVPAWYRRITGEVSGPKLADPKWRADPENPADTRAWLPGDSLYSDALFVSEDLAASEYDAIVDAQTRTSGVKLTIAGRDNEGWDALGRISIAP